MHQRVGGSSTRHSIMCCGEPLPTLSTHTAPHFAAPCRTPPHHTAPHHTAQCALLLLTLRVCVAARRIFCCFKASETIHTHTHTPSLAGGGTRPDCTPVSFVAKWTRGQDYQLLSTGVCLPPSLQMDIHPAPPQSKCCESNTVARCVSQPPLSSCQQSARSTLRWVYRPIT
jgi:hypothetical protein